MSKTLHMQLSVDADRWPDEMLDGLLSEDGRKLSAAEARAALRDLKAKGFEVVPCNETSDPETGRCRCYLNAGA